MKRVLSIHRRGGSHWVGDGFPVHTLFNYQTLGRELTPFLMLDHAGPAEFNAATKPRGVEWHPHRGFETVTIAFDGEVEHEDTAGNRGRIQPGDVQWMTAGAGVLHKEMHSADFTRSGGRFEVLQLWVNLPAASKLVEPRYQALVSTDIPVVTLPNETGTVRVIAGEFSGVRGIAKTFTPINLFDIRLQAGQQLTLELGDGYTAALLPMRGDITVNDEELVRATELAVFHRDGSAVTITAKADATIFAMSGEPIDEPIAGYGPFVMNTKEQIVKAFEDFEAGRFGTVPSN